MALVQGFPNFKVGKVSSVKELRDSSGESHVVEFRGGANLDRVVREILSRVRVHVDAAPGAGKSTKLPAAVAAATSLCVLHVLPYPQLAAATYGWVIREKKNLIPTLVRNVDEVFPESGLVITDAASLVARLLHNGVDSIPECVVLHDESHESGAASAVLRSLVDISRKVSHYASLSATAAPDGFRRIEPVGSIVEEFYEPGSFSDPWSVLDDGAPWAIEQIRRCMLIFEDDDVRAADLMAAYSLNHVVAFRWTSRTPVRTFLADLEIIEKGREACVVIADSSYRSGYTLPVDLIIDSGTVRRLVVDEFGAVRRRDRPLYKFEAHQSMARGGRINGLSAVYFRPCCQLQSVLCELEQTDIEAYCLIMRLLGFDVSAQFPGARFLQGRVPRDVCAALNSPIPLAALPESSLVELNEMCPIADLVSELASAAGEGLDSSSEVIEEDCYAEISLASGVEGILHDFGFSGGVQEPELGEPLNIQSNGFSLAFQSIIQEVSSYDQAGVLEKVVREVWDPERRCKSFDASAVMYNSLLIQLHGITLALSEAKKSAAEKDPVSLRTWATIRAEELVVCQAEMRHWFRIARLIAKGRFAFMKGPALDKRDIERHKSEVMRSFHAVKPKAQICAYSVSQMSCLPSSRVFRERLLEF